MSGDGTLSDAIWGVLKRHHGEETPILPSTQFKTIEKPVFGVIPAGSTDSLAMTIHGDNDQLISMLNIIAGCRIGLDAQLLFDSPSGFKPDNPEYNENDSKFCRICFTTVGGGGYLPKVQQKGADIRRVFKANRFTAAAVPILLANKSAPLAVYFKATPKQPKSTQIICSAR